MTRAIAGLIGAVTLLAGCGTLVARPDAMAVDVLYDAGKVRQAAVFSAAEVKEREAAGPSWELFERYLVATQAAGMAGRYEQQAELARKALALLDDPRVEEPARDAAYDPFSARPTARIQTLMQLAFACEELGRTDEQERALRAALAASAEVPFWSFTRPGWRAWPQEGLARVLRERARFDEALALRLDALSTRRMIMRLSTVVALTYPATVRMASEIFVRSSRDTAETFIAAGRSRDALPYTEDALAVARRHGLRDLESDLLGHLATIRYGDKAYADAATLLQQSIALKQAMDPDSAALVSRYTDLGRALRAQNRLDEALNAFREAIRRHEDFRATFVSARNRNVVFERRLQAYHLAALTSLDLGRVDAAFDLSERARARGFLDVLSHRTALSREGRPELLAEEQDLRARIEEVRSLPETGPLASQRRRLLADAREAYDRFLERLQRVDAEQASLRAVEPVSLAGVRALLPADTVLVEYLVTPEETLVWAVDAAGASSARIAIAEEDLRARVERLRTTIEDRDRDASERVAAELGASLLGILDTRPTARRLIVVPHGVLHYLPFQALRRRDRYLVEDVEVTYVPSASVIRFTREKAARPRSGPLVGIGNPDLGRSALDLAYAEQEVASLRARFPAATLLLGAEATRGRVRLLAPGARVLHFATHAELDDRDPLGSAILLAPSDGTNGRLEVHEIYGWSLAAELVVLSACETALGPVSEGDELVGLARAFIYAGAPSVVATLWQVDDRASAALMDRFYAGFATGATKAHALRAAQFEALRELGDPFFWAAYQLTGDGG